jgi:NADPH:quinone reductase-like Zn-dependent oxidoreductase
MSTLEQDSAAQSVPGTMRAAVVEHFGGPEVFSLQTLPVPEIDSDEVLIAVGTAGVGGWDADMRAGWSPGGHKRLPLILGSDGAGVVVAVGSRVERFEIGDEVYAFAWDNPKGGFYAEYVAAPSDTVSHIPESLDLKHAGAIAVTGLTALEGIDDALQISEGQAVIVHGASGGVGTLAIQFMKLRGARVFATASGNAGLKLARELGADVAVDGHHGDIAAAARQFAPDGVDAVLALAGGDTLARCVEVLRPRGRLAYPNGIEPEPKPGPHMEVITYDGKPGLREFEHLNQAVQAAHLKVPIAAEYDLDDVSQAHERLAQGHVLGKIILRIRDHLSH